jgi:phage FluMu gp28-like protein
MKEEVAEELDEDTQALLSRWEGRPDLFIEDVFRVRDLFTKEIEELELTDYQRQFVHALWYGDASTVSVLKGRRTGYSFIACATILAKAIVLDHSFHAITGPSKSQAKDRIEDIYDLIEWSKCFSREDLAVDNRDEIELWNGATIMAFSGNPDTSRGADSADILFVDEMEFLEDQKESMRAFSPFVALGDADTIEISTPKNSNSLFMDDIEAGSPEGENGIISIKQPSFENADEIDASTSLYKQNVEPVNPYQSVEEAEKQRARDPKGFEQEYLCRTVEDSYRFFSKDAIDRAIERGEQDSYVWHPATHAREGGTMIMGVDIAAGGNDDTAIAVFEHANGKRYLRFHTMLDEQDLDALGIGGKPENPSDMASYINSLAKNMGVERVYLDKTGVGEGFTNEVQKVLGRKAQGFDFDDKEEIERMMGDFNYALHNDEITLVEDEDQYLRAQLEAIVKSKNKRTSAPDFSGKDNAPDNKDDLAFALVLAAYPPNFNAERSTTAKKKENVQGFDDEGVPSPEGEVREQFVKHGPGSSQSDDSKHFGSVSVKERQSSRRNRRSYEQRHSR